MEGFDIVTQFVSLYEVEVTIYQSKTTGLRVTHVNIETLSNGIVNGHFVLATEGESDNGCPHCLEHLIFCGSKKYPFKGLLDKFANKALSRGTNAWTDIDHTCYTLTTAGTEGFLNILPIYLDHVMFPTLSEEAFLTEVHHVVEDGTDAGVVFCEMQGRNNTDGDLAMLALRREIFRDTPYVYETGGVMEDIRNLDCKTVREYFKKFYTPQNLNLIVTGKIGLEDLFNAVEPLEQDLVENGWKKNERRPFSGEIPPFEETVRKTVDFPCGEEDAGMVLIAWRGPVYNDFKKVICIQMLWEYLSDSSISPVQIDFVETEEPLCGEVEFELHEGKEDMCVLSFHGVPESDLEKIDNQLLVTLRKVYDEGFDMGRMKVIIERQCMQVYNMIETNPHITFVYSLIPDFLYGSGPEDTEDRFNYIERLRKLLTYDESFWKEMLMTDIINKPYVSIMARPSVDLGEKLRAEEHGRVERRKKEMGNQKMQLLSTNLQEAKRKNSTVVPSYILDKFDVPDMSKIHSIPVSVANFGPDDNLNSRSDQVLLNLLSANERSTELPLILEIDQVATKFVEIVLYISTVDMTPEERLFLQVFITNFFETTVRRDGKLVPHSEVIASLTEDTVSFESGLGIVGGSSHFSCGPFSQYFKIRMKANCNKYHALLGWFHDLLVHPVYEEDRLKVACMKLINDIPDHKRESFDMAQVISLDMNFHNPNSNYYARNVLRQEAFLKEQLVKRLNEEPEKVIEDLHGVRKKLCNLKNMIAQVIGDVRELGSPVTSWKNIFLSGSCGGKDFVVPDVYVPQKTLSDSNLYERKSPNVDGMIVSLPSSESSYMVACCQGPSSFDDPDIPALRVLLSYFSLFEGIFWVEIRGSGYAYSSDFSMSVDQGLIYFTLYRSTNFFAAFEQSKKLIEYFDLGVSHFTPNELEAAKSGCIFSKIASEETVSQAAFENFVLPHFKGTTRAQSKEYLNKVQAVTQKDLKRVLSKYVVQLFEPGKCSLAITSNPEHIGDIVANMRKASFSIEVMDSLEDICQLK
eukprot:Nk52_evm22s745 gene=Nk52_evmTU22s745